jgi:cell division septation protein DedD
MPGRGAARGRARGGSRWLQWVALLTAATVVMGLTFALGVLVGRQWGRSAAAGGMTESAARKTVPAGKRGGLSGESVETAAVDQKLTFYQTLTAPLGRGSADASPRHDNKPKSGSSPEAGRGEPSTPPPYPYASRAETSVGKPESIAADDKSAAEQSGPWAVQAAAFKTQAQADALQKQLKKSGLDAYVTQMTGSDGQVNYRVRVGTFMSKAEAQRVAERVRGERSLAAFITPK